MPTTYTHDLFGKKVYQKLPGEMKQAIRRYGDLYRIGLHGPDILFYYFPVKKNKVNQRGVQVHGEMARPFFENGIKQFREDEDVALLVYLLGFTCHYMLDSTCHPYIKKAVGEITHGEMEKEMDRYYMLQQGLNPFRFYPSHCIHPRTAYCKTITRMFPEFSYRTIQTALRGMRFMTDMMVYDDSGRKQMVILPVLKAFGQYRKVGGNYMKPVCDPKCDIYVEHLSKLFDQALEETPAMLEAVWKSAKEGQELPERFNRNYK